jgi:TP901 family phage tail tape measure protein
MSSPSVTATINANDLASPKVRELMATLKQAERLAKDAFDGGNIGGKYANSINAATLVAQKHVGVLHQIHAAHKAIAATVAGYAGMKLVHGGIDAIKHALPYLREDVAIKARTGYSESDMAMLRKQQTQMAEVYGARVEAIQKAHETFGRLKYDAATNVAITSPTVQGARAMGVTAEQNSELMESMISQYGVHFANPADAAKKVAHLNDIAAAATKKSNMTFEDVKEYTKYSAAAANAVNVSPEQNTAMGMALRRGGIVGSEAGVFARQLFARAMAPTRKGREIAAQNGINLDEYAAHGTMTGEGLSAKFSRTFGKGLIKESIAGINRELEENGEEILSDRGKFAEMVTRAVEKSGEKLNKTDQKHLSKAANEYYDWTKEGIRGGALLDRLIDTNSPMLMQGYLGDKQGARGVALLQERDKYLEAKKDLGHADGFAKNVADEMNKGLAASVDRLTSSAEALSNSMVQANEKWITGITDAATSVVGVFNNLSDSGKQTVGALAGIATVLAGGGLVYSMGSFVVSVNTASAALQTLAARAAVDGAIGAAPGAGSTASRLGKVLKAVPLIGAGYIAYEEFLKPHLVQEAAGTDDAKGGGVANYRRRLANMHATEFEDMVSDDGPFDRYQPADPWKRRRGATSEYLRSLGAADDGAGSALGWGDSIRNVAASNGFKDVAVNGTVTGSAELHNMIQVEVKPTTYFDGLVQRAESVAHMSLNGNLGTSMQGPGGNNTKPAQPAALGPTP